MISKSIEALCKENVIALTGGIASGKSTVAKIISEQNFYVFDADKIARELVLPNSPVLDQIIKRFGKQILAADGSLIRAELGKIVFNQPNARKDLEQIMHPAIRENFGKQLHLLIEKNSRLPIFYEAALIIETNRQDDFKEVWCVSCSRETQLKRLMERNQIDRTHAEKIISAQRLNSEKAKYCQIVINTDQPLEEIQKEVLKILKPL